MAHKSNTQLRAHTDRVLELRKGNRAQPIPAGRHRGSRSGRDRGALQFERRAWDAKLVD
jgi:hypothetical protein